ncbi:MAG: GNAT family N-acetyltransferase [Alphaproteobacteria bacterium]|nr:GNAT family N-acetyltransferase [Alphaproteobacteria bacterium]
MYTQRSGDFLAAARSDFAVEMATTADELHEVFRLRYQIYCLERGFEEGSNGLEFDEHDSFSRHIVLRHLPTGLAIGTVRLVVPRLQGPGARMPMEEVADAPRLRALPRAGIAEVSRFALSKVLRAQSASLGSLARLGLVRGLVQVSAKLNISHWCALMEPKLLRLLATTAIHFQPVGLMVEHHGLRQPCFTPLDGMLAQVRAERPEIWNFLTDAGRLWQAAPEAVAA